MISFAMEMSPARENDGFEAIDFPFESKTANLASIRLTKRYPESGFATNDTASHFVYVVCGGVMLKSRQPDGVARGFTLQAGDAVHIEPGDEYFWQPVPEVTLAVFCTPPWTPEQHRNVPE